MVQIKVSYYNFLLEILSELVSDLNLYNPEYRFVTDIGDNPVIKTLANELGYVPTYYALPTSRGVTFDLQKLNALNIELEKRRAAAIEVSNEVIAFELNRLGITDVQFHYNKGCNYTFQFEEKVWNGPCELFIQTTMNMSGLESTNELWETLNKVHAN